MILIGIDPGIHNGIAVYDTQQKKFLTVETLGFFALIQRYLVPYKALYSDALFIVENPNLNKPIFNKRGAHNVQAYMKIAQNVGSNKRTAQLIIEYMEKHDIPHKAVKPTTQKWKDTYLLKGVDGFPDQSNQHERDASKLCLLY